MTESLRALAVVDTTIAEHIANEAHGTRYGIDWIYHDDRLGFLPAKPVKALADRLASPGAGAVEPVAWMLDSEDARDRAATTDPHVIANWKANGFTLAPLVRHSDHAAALAARDAEIAGLREELRLHFATGVEAESDLIACERERDSLRQRVKAAEAKVEAVRNLCESWNDEARAEGFGGGNARANEILTAMQAEEGVR